MPYITVPQVKKSYQITFEDLINGMENIPKSVTEYDPTGTITRYIKVITEKHLRRVNVSFFIGELIEFTEKYENLINIEDKSCLYKSFKIPKRSGGFRQIDAPNPELMEALRELKEIMELRCGALYHTTAHAYVPKRNTVSAIKKHQKNHSKWFGKFDFSNFFGSTTLEFTLQQLSTIFPFSEILKNTIGAKVLKQALSLAFLNGGLPQGTPISPFITNVIMIPIDHSLNKIFKEDSHHFVYTRYADDIQVSSQWDFKIDEVQNIIVDILRKFNAPFSINTKKTRYGSNAGRNWNLGLMLNKDNNITVGWRKKKEFEATLHNFCMDYKNNKPWGLEDVYHMLGVWSYNRGIEPEFFDKLNKEMCLKTGINPIETAKRIIKEI